jgi:hypothetical protein
MESITLQTNDTIVTSGDFLGQLQFAASSESDGGASQLVVARIYAQAEGAFSASSNPASIIFATSSNDALAASGKIKIDDSGNILPLANMVYSLGSDALQFSNLYAVNSNTDLIGAIKIPCKNSTGSTISASIPVYISGHFANGKVYVDVARADTSAKMPAIGILSSGLVDQAEGDVYIFGTVIGLNTNGYAVGSTLYVSPTGGFTATKPTGVNELIQNMGRVSRADLNNGRIILLGPGRSNDIPNSGNFKLLTVNGVNVSISGHTHTASDITNFNSSVSGLLPTIANSGDNRVLTSTGSSVGINAESGLTFDGTSLSSPILVSTNASAQEGGEIQLAKAPSGSTSGNNIIIDVYNNQLRFFEQAGTNRGYYIDITSGGAGVATNLASGGGGGGVNITNPSDNRVLTSTGSSSGINAESNFTFDGSLLTVTGSGLFASGVNIANQTASTIASFDANKNVASLATTTYPSLTELSYVKGVTSAVQTQLNSKQATLTNPVTGTGTENYITKWNSASGLTNSTIFDTGNIGIGTSTPVTKLHIYSNGGGADAAAIIVQNNGNQLTDSPNITLYSISGQVGLSQNSIGVTSLTSLMGGDNTTSFSIGTSTPNPLILQTSGSSRVYIDPVGNVGIGKVPIVAFDVAGTGAFSSSLTVGRLLTAASGIFNSGLILNDQTASTIAGFDANKKVTTLDTATYPSLTELSYVKGVTSAIQTQINTKQNTLTNPVTGVGVSGYVSRWISSSGIGSGIIYDNTSRVGIRTASPTHELHVIGSGFIASGLSVSGNLTVNGTGVITNILAGTGISVSSSSGIFTINSTASGLSSAVDSFFSFNEVLTSGKSIFTVTNGYVSGVLDVYVNGIKLVRNIDYTANDGSTFTLTSSAASGDHIQYQGIKNVALLSSSGLAFAVGGSTRMFITTSGNIGINNTSPSQALDVSGTITATSLFGNIVDNRIMNARLSLESGVPVSTGNQSAKTILYYVPYNGNRVTLYNISRSGWELHNLSSQLSLSLGTLTSGRPYDVFLYDTSGTKALELTSWASDSGRATGIIFQDSVYARSGALDRRYVGTIRTSTATTTEDTETQRFVWNMYNKEPEFLFTNPGYNDNDADTTYTLTGASVTVLNGGTGAKTEMMCGLPTVVEVQVRLCGNASAGGGLSVGVGIDQTSNLDWAVNCRASEFIRGISSKRDYSLSAGYHAFNLLGINTASTTNTINADFARNFAGTKDFIGTSMSQSFLG